MFAMDNASPANPQFDGYFRSFSYSDNFVSTPTIEMCESTLLLPAELRLIVVLTNSASELRH